MEKKITISGNNYRKDTQNGKDWKTDVRNIRCLIKILKSIKLKWKNPFKEKKSAWIHGLIFKSVFEIFNTMIIGHANFYTTVILQIRNYVVVVLIQNLRTN